MILVTLGTQDKPFRRLIEAVEKQVLNGNIKEKVFVQAGYTNYTSSTENIKIIDYCSLQEMEKKMQEANIIITHGGVASIITGIKKEKKVIAAARKMEFGEHVNNHQEQIIENFAQSGYILELKDFEKLDEFLIQAENFVPKKFAGNNENFKSKLKLEIEELLS